MKKIALMTILILVLIKPSFTFATSSAIPYPNFILSQRTVEQSNKHAGIKMLTYFKDKFLQINQWGENLVKLYYKYSPAIKNYVAKNDIFRMITRTILKPVEILIKTDREVAKKYRYSYRR